MLKLLTKYAVTYLWCKKSLGSDRKALQEICDLVYQKINEGNFDEASGYYDRALELFEKALDHRQQQGKSELILIAKWCVAKTLRMLGRVDSALAMQFELEKNREKAGEQDGFVYEEIAECLLTLNRKEEARKYFAIASQNLSKDPWLSRDEPERLERLKRLGQVK